MLNDLINEYIEMFGEEPEANGFYLIEEDEQIRILSECLEKKQPLSENEYYNKTYMEEVE